MARGRIFLSDFGIAGAHAGASGPGPAVTKLTRTGVLLGTVAYMSPEQARGELDRLTPAADVWGLGCLGVELCAGRPAFAADTPAEALARVLGGAPAPLPGVPAPIARWLVALLAKDPWRRPAHAGAVRDDAQRLLRGAAPRHRARRRGGAWAVAALLLAGGAVAAWWTTGPGAGAPTADPRAAPAAALAAEPGYHRARMKRGLVLEALDRGAEAEAEYRRVLADVPGEPRATCHLARLRRRARRAADARPLLDAAIDRHPRDAELRFWRGVVRLDADDAAGALADLDVAVRGLAGHAEALPEWEAGLALAPDDLEGRLGRAMTRVRLGDRAAGLAEALAVAARPDAPAVAHWAVALLHWDGGDLAAARASAERFVAEAPDHPNAPHAREMIAECARRLGNG